MVPTLSSQPRFGSSVFDKTTKELDHSWGFRMPLTPPSSPPFYSSPEDDEFDCCFRVQPVCGLYDDITEEHAYASAGVLDIPTFTRPGKSVVIKDCMWGHWSSSDVTTRLQDYESKSKLERASELQDPAEETMESSTVKFVGVDPSEVFPRHEDSLRMQTLSDYSDSDDESDIDVVTVENSFRPVETSNPTSPSILSPPKTPDVEYGSADMKASSPYSPLTFSPPKLKLDVTQAVAKSLSIIADRGTTKSPRKHITSSGEVKYSRTSHNVLERKRRNELKMRFYNLRDAIPELTENDKVPKVTILKQAILYVKSLKTEETVLLGEEQRQKKINSDLRKRIALLLKRS